MAVTCVARVVVVAPIGAIPKDTVGEVTFDDGALGRVGIVEHPAPGRTKE